MLKEDIYNKFCVMFPDWEKRVTGYRKVGSRAISLMMDDGTSKVFLYTNDNDWQFGTKIWRKVPTSGKGGEIK